MNLMVNPVITDFQQDVNGDIKMLKLGANKEDAWANIAEQGASAKLDNNKTKTIDVSTYTEPVEVLPTSGKDGMKKATVTLSNIPSGSATAYYWSGNLGQIKYNTNFDKAPATREEFAQSKYVEYESGRLTVHTFSGSVMTDYTKVSDTEFTAKWDGDLYTFVRNSSYDCTLWGD